MYDIVIIGGGPAGYRAAELAGRRGLDTALIEGGNLGGTCLNCGCIPFKSYLNKSAAVYHFSTLVKKKLVLSDAGISVSMDNIRKEKDRIVSTLRQGIMEGLKNGGVDVITGMGRIVSTNSDSIWINAEGTEIRGKRVIIASGAKEVSITIKRKELFYPVFYSDGLLEMNEIPKKAFIVGGGVIGIEAACFLTEAGCDVTVIEAADHIGSEIERDISENLKGILEKKGIRFLLETVVTDFSPTRISLQRRLEKFCLHAETVTIAVGRKPNLDGIGLDIAGVKYNEQGILVNEKCETSNTLIYACGDVTGKMMLAHTAYRHAKVAVDNICGIESTMNYDIIPRIIYTNPEVLCVGLTEEQCKKRRIEYVVCTLPMTYSGKYFAEHGKDGARAKMIIDKENHRILGFHMVGNGAAEISLAVELMITKHLTVEEIGSLIFAHPTVGEIIHEIAEAFLLQQ